MSDQYIRKAFLMSVNEGCHAEYEKRHDEIWPELVRVLKEHGARNYSIFLEPGSSQLFAYVEIESEERWNQVADTEECQKWWAFMKDIMATNPDNSPVSLELKNVFYLE
ncbi:L-rhamnose mutarotase [Vibrio sp. HA2012]|uniref:L-rhamnose mutarotase n=1 Tax=Vibrio sp. HA2012 TaxID=1971595 RepID=UPI000C2CBE0C|nr:L-rhamnose mutarotase [Vibrio sp. HA2012]PJC87185.1 L-rhamnose mutarotase [Vibrio sp. HA2012]